MLCAYQTGVMMWVIHGFNYAGSLAHLLIKLNVYALSLYTVFHKRHPFLSVVVQFSQMAINLHEFF